MTWLFLSLLLDVHFTKKSSFFFRRISIQFSRRDIYDWKKWRVNTIENHFYDVIECVAVNDKKFYVSRNCKSFFVHLIHFRREKKGNRKDNYDEFLKWTQKSRNA